MTFNSFVNVFTNSPVQTAYPSYLALDFTDLTVVQLEWSFQNQNTLFPFSQTIQVITNPSSTSRINLPNATVTSVMQETQIINSSANNIVIYDFGGNFLATIEPTQEWFVGCTNNTTAAGIWLFTQLGATTSAVIASSLIDPTFDSNGNSNSGGLAAFATNYLKWDQKVNVFTSTSTPGTYTQETGDRGSVFVWNGAGNLTYVCQAANNSAGGFGDGFTWSIFNASTGGGVITVEPQSGDTINNLATSFQIFSGFSSTFVSNGINTIYALGTTEPATSVVDLVNINVNTAIGNVITLTPSQYAFSIQKFSGTNGSSVITINYPADVVNEYVLYNDSTNTLLVQQISETQSIYQYTVLPDDYISLFSDGNHLFATPNLLKLAPGTTQNPPISFQTTNLIGLYPSDSTVSLNTTINTNTTWSMQETQNLAYVNMNTSDCSYLDNGLSIYTLVRAYG